MAGGFDPYYKWLGIPPEEQPPNHYRLLGLRLFEPDCEVIESAADQRMTHLRTYQTGQHSALSQKLLNEVAAAKVCLLSAQKREQYDRTLNGSRIASPPAMPNVVATLPPPPPLAATNKAQDDIFDFGTIGMEGVSRSTVSEIRAGSGISRRGAATSADASPRVSQRATDRRWVIMASIACLVLLGLTAAVIYWRGSKPAVSDTTAGKSSSPQPGQKDSGHASGLPVPPGGNVGLSADQELALLKKHLHDFGGDVSNSPLIGTPLGEALALHMNFEQNTIIEREGVVLVRDLSGSEHHAVSCGAKYVASGHLGGALECRTPLRFLSGLVNLSRSFTVVAWVRHPSGATDAGWFCEQQGTDCLFGVAVGNQLRFRAMSKSRKVTTAPIGLPMLLTPADQWNFIAVRGDVRPNGDGYVSFDVNAKKIALNNNDLFPVAVGGAASRMVMAEFSGLQLDEVMAFHRALSDAEIAALRGNPDPWKAPAVVGNAITERVGGNIGLGDGPEQPKPPQAVPDAGSPKAEERPVDSRRVESPSQNPFGSPTNGPKPLPGLPGPVLLEPPAGATLSNSGSAGAWIFRWQPVPGAIRYGVRVQPPGGGPALVDVTDFQGTTLRVRSDSKLPKEFCRGWKWLVRAMVNGQWSEWSESRSFDLAAPQ